MNSSDAGAEILVLRNGRLHGPPPRQRVPDTRGDAVRRRLRDIPPHDARDLPDARCRARARRAPRRAARRRRPGPAPAAAVAEHGALRGRHAGHVRAAQDAGGAVGQGRRRRGAPVAAVDVHFLVWVCAGAILRGARLHEQGGAARRRGGQLQHWAGVCRARLCQAPRHVEARVPGAVGHGERAHGLGAGTVVRHGAVDRGLERQGERGRGQEDEDTAEEKVVECSRSRCWACGLVGDRGARSCSKGGIGGWLGGKGV